jgi:hypothetical protein
MHLYQVGTWTNIKQEEQQQVICNIPIAHANAMDMAKSTQNIP